MWNPTLGTKEGSVDRNVGRDLAATSSEKSGPGGSPDSPAVLLPGSTSADSRIPPEQAFAVTVTFNPKLEDGRLSSQVAAVSRRFGLHVIVDNHSENLLEIAAIVARSALDPSRVHLVELDRNAGIARALNEGVAKCRKLGNPRWILTLDQDTTFPDTAFPALERELPEVKDLERTGILAFNYFEHRFNSSRPYNHSTGPAPMHSIITSGNLVRTDIFDKIRFDERLFLYFVDVDFCRRVRALGYSIVVLRQTFIDHEEGVRAVRHGRPQYYLDPARLFYVSRNGCVMFARYHTLQDLVIAAYLVAMNMVTGARPIASLREAIRGALAAPSFLRAEP
ncbi:MAG: glycosyltransferase [Thermoplasmata archaeon]|nr:glycosyltransferase [Thermoplasmata archaeon]